MLRALDNARTQNSEVLKEEKSPNLRENILTVSSKRRDAAEIRV